jgi:hypothetical protein
VFQHVGFTVNAVNAEMRAAYDARVFTADTAANEVGAITAVEFGTARFSIRITVGGGVMSRCIEWRRYIRRGKVQVNGNP